METTTTPGTEKTETMNADAYRAADTDYAGPGACYATTRSAAEAYTDNLGYGGGTLYAVVLADDASILDLTGENWSRLAEVYRVEVWDEWDEDYRVADGHDLKRDIGVAYCSIYEAIEHRESIRDAIIDAGYTHIRYDDDYPEDCVTVQRLADGADTLTTI